MPDMSNNGIDVTGVRSDRIRRAIEALDNETLRQLRERGDIVVKTDPYFSKARFAATVSGSGPYQYDLPKMELPFFNYAIGDAIGAVNGFSTVPPYDKATRADTNLLTARETVNNDWNFVNGIYLMINPTSDPILVKKIFPEVYCRIDMSGNNDFVKLGSPFFLGGGPGLFGAGDSALQMPNAFDSRYFAPGFVCNGMPDPAGAHPLAEVLVWGPKASADSNFTLTLELTRPISFQVATRAAAATPGVPAFTPPTATNADGTFVELVVVLDCTQVGSRSRNR